MWIRGCLIKLVLLNLVFVTKVYSDRTVDDYVLSAQTECFQSKQLFSCFKYKASRYLWSIATGQRNLFVQDGKSDSKGNFNLVHLSEPSNEIMFPEARESTTDTGSLKFWKFIKRSLAKFLTNHGFAITMKNGIEARVIEDKANPDNARLTKRKKWQIIAPLAILIKLMHLKLMVTSAIIGIGVVQLMLFGGGALLYYYIIHNPWCKLEPYPIHTHSHSYDIVGADSPEMVRIFDFFKRALSKFLTNHGLQFTLNSESGAKVIEDNAIEYREPRIKKKKKWGVILPLIILFKIMKLNMMVMKVTFGIGIIQLMLIGGGIALFYYLKHNTFCKIQPHLVHSHSHVLDTHEGEIPYSSYASYHSGGSSYPAYFTGTKDWSSRKSFTTYND